MAILVVGGAGYIGSHMVRKLKNDNCDVVVFDNLEKGHLESISGVPFCQGDTRNKEDLKKVFEQFDIDSVMHFSAYSLVGESMVYPERYYENNIYGTLNLLTEMKKYGVRHFIFSSTAAVYGDPVDVPITENHTVLPINVYGETKLVVEKMLGWFDAVDGLKSVCLRYFNAAGADPKGDIGELHDPETHLIPLVMEAALGERDHIAVFGDNYATKDGTCIRDYIHVNDLAAAHALALEYLRAGGDSNIFNLGNGSGYSVKEVIEVAGKAIGRDIPVRTAERRPGDPAILIASSEKAKRILGWSPSFFDIETIIETAWKWHSGTAKTWNR